MRSISLLALLLTTAAPPALAAPAPEQAPAAATPPATPPTAAPTTSKPATDAPVLRPVANADEQRLVNGAPLNDPNVALHVVQKKPFADEGRHEFTLDPAVVQVNGRFTQHYGSALSYTYHLQENFALQLTGQYNWYANESAFNLELIDKVREQAQAASALLLGWGALAGVEVTPLYGKFAFYDNHLLQFSLVLNGAAGVGSTRVLIRPQVANQVDGETSIVPARFGDTGTKFLGSVGGGFRVQFGNSMALRLEIRDQVYTARVDRVDGCNLADFTALDNARSAGQDFSTLSLSGGCQYQKFSGVDPKTHKDNSEDIVLGKDLVGNPSSDVLNNVGFYAGFSYLF